MPLAGNKVNLLEEQKKIEGGVGAEWYQMKLE